MITFANVTKRYPTGFEALRDVSLDIQAGEFVFVTGHSGAGKTTLVKLMAAIERPTSGGIIVNGQNLSALRASALPFLRRNFGLVFQDQKLLFDRPVLANVLLPLEIAGTPPREAKKRALAALDKVGLLDREKALPIALSGGEQQRLAIARAVVNRPAILLADEPTANLDAASAGQILSIFNSFNQVGVTVILATHDLQWVDKLQPRVLWLAKGKLHEGLPAQSPVELAPLNALAVPGASDTLIEEATR